MAKFKAIKRGYDNKKVLEVGEEFTFTGVPGSWMEPMDDEAKALVKKHAELKSEKPKKEEAKKA